MSSRFWSFVVSTHWISSSLSSVSTPCPISSPHSAHPPCGRNRRVQEPLRTRRMRSMALWRYKTLIHRFEKPKWSARMTEKADSLSGPRCACTRAVVVASTLWNGQDAVDQTRESLAPKRCNLRERRSVQIQKCCHQWHDRARCTYLHSCFQYTVLIKCSICSCPHWMRTLREWLKK